MELWRDLKLGEEIKIGDRCFGQGEEWFVIEDLNLEFQRHVTEFSRLIQRKVEVKDIATSFFYDWYNSPGSNTGQGFDDWWEKNKARFGVKSQ